MMSHSHSPWIPWILEISNFCTGLPNGPDRLIEQIGGVTRMHDAVGPSTGGSNATGLRPYARSLLNLVNKQ